MLHGFLTLPGGRFDLDGGGIAWWIRIEIEVYTYAHVPGNSDLSANPS